MFTEISKIISRICILLFVFFSVAFAQEKWVDDPSDFFLAKQHVVNEIDQNIDVLHYDIHLDILYEKNHINGFTRLKLINNESSSEYIFLNLKGLQVDSVKIDEHQADYTKSDDYVAVHTIGQDTLNITIYYQGTPGNDGYGGFFFKDGYAYNSGQGLNSYPPPTLRYWVPSHDVPDDKALMDIHLTVPRKSKAYSNGLLMSVKDSLDKKIYHWRETNPIAPYLIAIAVGDFAEYKQTYTSTTGKEIQLEWYVYPKNFETALEDWKYLPQMMAVYEDLFGPYPFDRYSMVELPKRGAMEHQGMTSYSSQLLTGDHTYDYIVAHELAHHWWGDWVTVADWRELWLNEGFATYSEALYFEQINGIGYLQGYMDYIKKYYFDEVSRRGHFSIYDPDYLWGGTIYQKGAWVLHMLRKVVGYDVFFPALRSYGEKYAYANSFIDDFKSEMESFYGQDLTWFFDQWIYRPGYPLIKQSWNYVKQGDEYKVSLNLQQTHENDQPFILPMDISIQQNEHQQIFDINFDQFNQSFKFTVDHYPTDLTIDPFGWVLKRVDVVSKPLPVGIQVNGFSLSHVYPNPFDASTKAATIFYQIDGRNTPRNVSLKIYNVLGQIVRTFFDESRAAGLFTQTWDGRDDRGALLSTGIYFVQLADAHKTMTQKLFLVQ